MPYKKFDRSRLNILPIDMKQHDLTKNIRTCSVPDTVKNKPALASVAAAMKNAAAHQAASLMMCGGHVIRSGCGPKITDMMKHGYVTHYATNGAGSIHDFELSLIGATCESVAKYISEGQFGLWRESAIINDILKQGVAEGLGAGEAIGDNLGTETALREEYSGYGLPPGIPCTGIWRGQRYNTRAPTATEAVLGEASYTDFLILRRQ